jgi:hypothetical protein
MTHLKALTECATIVFPFIIRQHAHISCKHIFACSCPHMEHTQAPLPIVLTFICCFDLVSIYNHKATRGNPITKKTIIVLIGICNTNKDRPKKTVPIPRMKSHRVVIFTYNFTFKANIISAYLITSVSIFYAFYCRWMSTHV